MTSSNRYLDWGWSAAFALAGEATFTPHTSIEKMGAPVIRYPRADLAVEREA
jgi:hypothetical protein